MEQRVIIGLAGYARVGKNEAAKGLIPMGFRQIGFADKVRDFLYTLNPIVSPRRQQAFGPFLEPEPLQVVIDKYGWDGYKDTPYGPHIREYLQRLGTECGRNGLYENVWIDATFREVQHDPHVVITDVRFPNEVQAIHNRGGMVIKIIKEGVGPANNHPSETALDDWKPDALITNDSTIENLHRKVRAFAHLESWPVRS